MTVAKSLFHQSSRKVLCIIALLVSAFLTRVQAVPVCVIELFGINYDVYYAAGNPSFKALSNTVETDLGELGTFFNPTAVGTVGDMGGVFSAGRHLSINVPDHKEASRSAIEDISDNGQWFIGWRWEGSGHPPRAFLWTRGEGHEYLDEAYPAVKALAETPVPGDPDNMWGARGLEVNNSGLMVIQSAESGVSPQGYYLLTLEGKVTPINADGVWFDLNNMGEFPPKGEFVMNDSGDYAGVFRTNPEEEDNVNFATRNGAVLAGSEDSWATDINNLGDVINSKGVVWTADGDRIDVLAALRDQCDADLVQDLNLGELSSSSAFISDQRNVVFSNLLLRRSCAGVFLSGRPISGLTFSQVDGSLVAQLGETFTVQISITNFGKGIVENVEIAPESDWTNYFQLESLDGTVPTRLLPETNVTYQATYKVIRPGRYKGITTLKGDNACGGTISESMTRTHISVPGVGLDVTVDPNTSFKPGEVFTAKVSVSYSGDEAQTFEFIDPILASSKEDLLTISETESPGIFTLSGNSATREFTIPVRAEKYGLTELTSTLRATNADGITEETTATKDVVISPMETEVKVTPKALALNQTSPERFGARSRAYNAERQAKELPVFPNCIEIEMKVTHQGEEGDPVLKGVTVPGALDILSFIKNTSLKHPGVPLRPVRFYPPKGDPIDLAMPEGKPEIEEVDLAPGESATFAWLVDAFDGNPDPEDDDSVKLEFKALVLAGLEGKNVRELATADFNVVDKPLLKWGMRPTGNRTDHLSGELADVDGYIENITVDKDGVGDPKLLRVLVYQIPEGNVGGGFVVPSTQQGPPATELKWFDLPATGPKKRLNVKSLIRSLRTEKASKGTIRYGIELKVVPEDGLPIKANEQVLLDSDYTDKIDFRFAAQEVIENHYLEDCLDLGFPPILCAFNVGFTGDFVDGAYGLMQFGLSGLETAGEGSIRLAAYELWAVAEIFDATWNNNPEARKALLNEAYTLYLTYHELGVMAGQVAGQAPTAFKAFSVQAGESVGRFLDAAIRKRDLKEVQLQVGHFLGANPDMLFEVVSVGKMFATLAKSLKRTGTGLADNVYTASARQRQASQAATVEARVAAGAADPNVTNLATVLKAGDEIKPGIMRQVFGVSQKTVKRLQDFAKNNEIILAFRSRHPRAQELLDQALAWAKPQALKFKTVNEIDIDFLGYRRNSLARVEIVEPPAGIIGKSGKDLDTALNVYMDKLVGQHPKLQKNAVLRREVRGRLKVRAKEWNKYAPELQLNQLDKKVEIGVNFGKGDQYVRDVSGDIGVSETREIVRKKSGEVTDAVTGRPRKVWEIKMGGPNGAEARHVVGDIDFLGILDKYGRMIRDADKRNAIYEQLQEFMEHGESFTFREQASRAEWLRCCTVGGEAMLTVGPWTGAPRAAFFVDSLSVVDEFNALFKRLRKTEPKLNKAGEIEFDAEGNPVLVTLRHETPSGEFTLINGVPLLVNPGKAFVKTFTPLLFDRVWADFKKRIPYYFPSLVDKVLRNNKDNDPNAQSAAVFSKDAPILQLSAVSEIDLIVPDELRTWTTNSGWQPITVKAAFDAGDPNEPDMAPTTSIPDGALAGTRSLPITPADDLSCVGDFFEVKDIIVINPGGENEETATIAAVNPIILSRPLANDHEAGEMIAWIGIDTNFGAAGSYESWAAAQGLTGLNSAPLSDPDGDGQSNLMEFALGTLPRDNSSISTLPDPSVDAGGQTTISISKPADVSGVHYEVEWSSNGREWANFGFEVIEDTPERLTVRLLIGFDAALLRLKVELLE